MLRAGLFTLIALCTACASPNLENFSYSELPQKPVLGGGTCDAEAVAQLRESLRPILQQDLDSGLVRVVYDGNSQIESVCVVRDEGSWRTRHALSDVLATTDSLPPGPACVGGHRIDLNRYQAKLAQIKRAKRECETQVNATISTNRNSGMDLRQVAARELENCMAFKSDWVTIDRGLKPPLLFGRPQLGPPPKVSARETVNRCVRETGPVSSIETQVACIQEDGWEMIRRTTSNRDRRRPLAGCGKTPCRRFNRMVHG